MSLKKSEYALIMSKYASLCLNSAKYDSAYQYINWKKSAKYARILNVSDTVNSIRSLYKLLSSYQDKRIQDTVKYLRCSIVQKE